MLWSVSKHLNIPQMLDALGTLRILEAIRILKLEKKVKFYQASTSELFGNTKESRQMKQHLFLLKVLML